MPRRASRTASLLLALGLLVPTLAACGGDEGPSGSSGSSEGAAGLAAVEVGGEVGESIEVTWNGRMTVEETESEVLVEGDGTEVASGDRVLAQIYVGNGFTQEEALSTYSAEPSQPQLVTVDPQAFIPAVAEAVQGVPVGSRVAVAATPADAFGETGRPDIGLGNADPVLFVVDVVSTVLEGPVGEKVEPTNPVPDVEVTDGTVSSLSFPPSVRPTDRLVATTLIRGDGPEVTADSTVVVDYLGQVLGKRKPFDESYSSPDPVAFPLGGVVEGWQQGLEGVPVGSRVVLQIPPRLGYGEQGQPSAGIGGEDTLVFVIDVLGAS